MLSYICPQDKNVLTAGQDNYTCSHCRAIFPIINGVIQFVQSDFYWGEIPEKKMDEILKLIQTEGYQQGLKYLEDNFPGRSKFVFDYGRADWHWPIDIKPGMKILDLGCGWGTHSFPLATLGAEVYAVDLTKQRTEFVAARKKFEQRDNVYPLMANVMALPFANNTFDLIISNGVLEWIGLQTDYGKPPEAQAEFLNKMKSLLKTDGVFYIGIENRWAATYLTGGIDHSGLHFTSWLPRLLANWYTKIRLKKPYLTYSYSQKRYLKLFKSSGFSQVQTYIPFPGYNNPQSLVPYHNLNALEFFVASRGKFADFKPAWLKKILLSKLFLRIYRRLVFSFSFYLSK